MIVLHYVLLSCVLCYSPTVNLPTPPLFIHIVTCSYCYSLITTLSSPLLSSFLLFPFLPFYHLLPSHFLCVVYTSPINNLTYQQSHLSTISLQQFIMFTPIYPSILHNHQYNIFRARTEPSQYLHQCSCSIGRLLHL
jgi:hypothetical protein